MKLQPSLPYLALPSQTDKSVALDVFIKMNTNSKPLSQYDVIVAEVESVMGKSLHDLQENLENKHPAIRRYGELANMILATSALLQGKFPREDPLLYPNLPGVERRYGGCWYD